MTLPTAVLSLLLMTSGSPADATDRWDSVLRFCKLELTEAGRRAAFSFQYFYALRTDEGGKVVGVERRTERQYPPFVREETFEPCLRTWRLRPSSRYGVVIRVGTTGPENSITVQRAGHSKLQLLLPR